MAGLAGLGASLALASAAAPVATTPVSYERATSAAAMGGVPAGVPSRAAGSAAGAQTADAPLALAGSRPRPSQLPCSARLTGGEWPSYGHDPSNTRTQTEEHQLGTSQAAGLTPAWIFSLSSAHDTGQFESTPTVAGGCAFVASTSGTVFAVDVTSGKPAWRTALRVPNPGLGGGIVGAVAVNRGSVVVVVNQAGDGTTGPYAAALDMHSGHVLWTSAPFSTQAGFYTNGSPQVFNGVVFAGFSPPEGESGAQGGFVLLDAGTGATLATTPTISPADQAQGFAGGGIWSTPAFDPGTGFAYVGAGNPYSKTKEDVRTNAILKVDVRRSSPTFGQIVASYKGNVDQYTGALEALSQTPVCAASDGPLPTTFDDPACGQLDLDFGAAPNLFSIGGRKVVGDLQKSGVYHVADAGAMTPVWSTIVGASCAVCNAASTAVAGGSVFGESTPGGTAFALGGTTGARRWATPVGDGVHYQPTSTANGVAYTFDTTGFFDAFDAATGLPLLRRPITADAGAPAAAFTSGGVAIAYDRVFVAASEGGPAAGTPQDGFLVAYQQGTVPLP